MRNERGFALIAALWLLVALSAVGLEFSLRARERRLAAANVREGLQAHAAAEAGLAHARGRFQRLLEDAEGLAGATSPDRVADPWGGPGPLLPDSALLGEARYRVHFRDTGAALNLNRASEEEILRLLLALRVDAGRAEQVAQSVMDWRDADDLHRGRGAEREDYLRRGAPVLPRNGPFEELRELRHVKGVTPALYAEVAPHLTLLGSGQVNLNTAGRPVLLALPGMSDEAVSLVLRYRRQGWRIGNLSEIPPELSSEARALFLAELPRLLSRATLETREVEVGAEGWIEGSRVRARMEGLLVRAGGTVYLVWKRTR